MKTITQTYYKYNELSEEAKENVARWYLDDAMRDEYFSEDVENTLFEDFKNSNLHVVFSLCNCQGDGLNIEGRLNLYDFIDFWEASEKEKRTIKKYIDNSLYYYDFYKNNHYGYSCKFLDKKYIEDEIKEFVDNLEYLSFKNIKIDIIRKFYNNMIDYFEELDDYFKKAGYKYFYEPDEEEIATACDANEWYFDEEGNFAREAC
jgi:hypothetical protein